MGQASYAYSSKKLDYGSLQSVETCFVVLFNLALNSGQPDLRGYIKNQKKTYKRNGTVAIDISIE